MAALGTLGRYRLIRRLAAGGMGEVYLAELPGVANFNQRVAIKRILPHLARDSDFVEKFIDEAHIMMRLHHGNIVGVHELADQDGELCIVMEYLPGRDLKAVTRRLRERRQVMPVDLALWLVGEICSALDYAHRKVDEHGAPMRIVHRDVSPSNVLLGAAGEVKLLDFGIARARGKLHQSVSGTLQGKFVYMSPEQADGRSVDARSDIYSAGLVLYELITGVRPFEGESETETLRKVRSGLVELPCAVRPELPPELDALVMQALASDPAERYATAAAMRRALQLYLGDTRSHADAQQLSEWLGTLFPEGVESRQGPTGPMSIEDALELQLGALTPNIDPMTRTHTAEPGAVGATPARLINTPTPARLANTPTPTPLPTAAITGSQPAFISQPGVPAIQVTDPALQVPMVPAKGRKRALALAVLFGALVATVAALWWLNRSVATIKAEVTGPGDGAFSVRLDSPNGPELLAGVELDVGKRITLCVVAEGYLPECKPLILAEGLNRPGFKPKAVPQVQLRVVPAHLSVGFTLDGEPRAPGRYRVTHQTDVRVCVSEAPPGWRLAAGQTTCVTMRGKNGVVRHVERSFEMIPDAAAEPPPVDAGVPTPTPDASPPTRSKVRPPPRPRTARHVVSVAQPGATMSCDGATYVSFPATLELTRDTTCTVTAPDHAPKRVKFSRRRGKRHTVQLQRFGRLTVRATPGAAKLLINGKMMKDSFLKKHRLAPGAVVIEARFIEDGKLYTARKSVTLAPGKELTTGICVKTAKLDCPGGA